MIHTFKHKGLKLFFENNDPSKLQAHHIEKIRRILYRMDEAADINDLNVVGWNLHQLQGTLKGFWSVRVNGNYRITFRFVDGRAFDLDYVDYH
jgi:proteic killer suppression protein